MSDIKKLENAKIEVTSVIEGEEWAKAQDKAFKKIAKDIEIKGFRKGQAPEHMIRQHIKEEGILAEAAQDIAQSKLEEAMKEHDLRLIDRPELRINSITKESCSLGFICPVYPDVELGDYKKVKFEKEKVEVKDDEVTKELDRIKEQKAELELKEDGVVEKGNTVVLDFEGFKDGVPFEGGKADNYELVIGSGSFIPGFEDQMIGMKAEEEKDINVTFPENYHVEDLKGKPVVFKVKVHEIKNKVVNELNDDLVKDLKIDGVNTVDELKNHLKDQLLKNKEIEAENKATEKLLDQLIDISKIDIPAVMTSHEVDQMMNEYASRFMQQGIPFDQFLKMTGQTAEELKKTFEPQAIKRVKTTLILEEIVKKEKIDVTEEDLNKYYDDLSKQYNNMPIEDIKKYLTPDQVTGDLKLQKALDLLKK